jgi:hypothetical protein
MISSTECNFRYAQGMFLDAGMDPDAKVNDGRTALEAAVKIC